MTLVATATLANDYELQNSMQHKQYNVINEPDGYDPLSGTSSSSNWVLALNENWLDDNSYRGAYIAARGVTDDHLYIEFGVLAQKLPRKNSLEPDMTRYFMALRVGLETLISPYFSFGIDPFQPIMDKWFHDHDEENRRTNIHTQLGLSLKPTDFFRVDLYGSLIGIDKHDSRKEVYSRYYRSAGVRLNLLF